MSPLDDLERALTNTARLVRGVRDEQWGTPTPCAQWDVGALVNHATWVTEMFANAAQGKPPAMDRDERVLGSDPAGDFDRAAQAALAAWQSRGLEGTVKIPIGELPAAVAIRINTTDAFIHGWDVAQATGQDAQLDDAIGETLLAFITPLVPPEPRGDNFGPVVDVPADAPATDRLLAYSGRKP